VDGQHDPYGYCDFGVPGHYSAHCMSPIEQVGGVTNIVYLQIFDMFYVHDRGRMLSVYLFGQQLGSMCVLDITYPYGSSQY
jgi:hypothetical protein